MYEVTAHTSVPDIMSDPRMQESFRRLDSTVAVALAAGGPTAGHLMSLYLTFAGRYLVREEHAHAVHCLHVAADIAQVVFEGTCADGRRVYRVRGQAFEGPTVSAYHGANAVSWMHSFCLGALLRRGDLLDALEAFDMPRLLASPTGAFDPYVLSLVEGMRLFRRGDPRYEEHLGEAWEQSARHRIRVATPRIVARFRTLVPLIRAVARKDQGAFDQALLDALNAHKGYFARGVDRESPDGALAYHAAGIATFGVDRGLSLGVLSGYAPHWLICSKEMS